MSHTTTSTSTDNVSGSLTAYLVSDGTYRLIDINTNPNIILDNTHPTMLSSFAHIEYLENIEKNKKIPYINVGDNFLYFHRIELSHEILKNITFNTFLGYDVLKKYCIRKENITDLFSTDNKYNHITLYNYQNCPVCSADKTLESELSIADEKPFLYWNISLELDKTNDNASKYYHTLHNNTSAILTIQYDNKEEKNICSQNLLAVIDLFIKHNEISLIGSTVFQSTDVAEIENNKIINGKVYLDIEKSYTKNNTSQPKEEHIKPPIKHHSKLQISDVQYEPTILDNIVKIGSSFLNNTIFHLESTLSNNPNQSYIKVPMDMIKENNEGLSI